ncbi:hypothetical protein WJU16_02960 [Chitinophaga pollutisoli]|uniref:HEPN domain-containing protein n=1 Tax=Chitinophaga pollutisoli TaxID=3133966 RepID=A0ABZ2YR34_9BACT
MEETLDSLQLRLYRIKKGAEEIYWKAYFLANLIEDDRNAKHEYLFTLMEALDEAQKLQLPVEDVASGHIMTNTFLKIATDFEQTDSIEVIKEVNDLKASVGFCLHYWPEVNSQTFDYGALRSDISWQDWKHQTFDLLSKIRHHLSDFKKSMEI